jgi:hypothetical protein
MTMLWISLLEPGPGVSRDAKIKAPWVTRGAFAFFIDICFQI